ncbi:Hypothetical protein MVR_LOCUS145 [uncultured virus]|nr:Hypothetical protein MVR_LOCUS145 [uncultured virus]
MSSASSIPGLPMQTTIIVDEKNNVTATTVFAIIVISALIFLCTAMWKDFFMYIERLYFPEGGGIIFKFMYLVLMTVLIIIIILLIKKWFV